MNNYVPSITIVIDDRGTHVFPYESQGILKKATDALLDRMKFLTDQCRFLPQDSSLYQELEDDLMGEDESAAAEEFFSGPQPDPIIWTNNGSEIYVGDIPLASTYSHPHLTNKIPIID